MRRFEYPGLYLGDSERRWITRTLPVYEALKMLHQATVVVTISLFVYRFSLLVRFPDRKLPRTLKILPHINDTLLLSAAIGMLAILQLNPLTSSWLLAKLLALLLYVALGAMCLRAQPGSSRQTWLFVAAVACFFYIALAALRKSWLPWQASLPVS